MTASAVGSTLLVLIGIAFLGAAAGGWRRLGEDSSTRPLRRTGVVIDVLVGLTALGDGAVSLVGEPERAVVWSLGSVALVVAVALLLVRRRRHPGLGS